MTDPEAVEGADVPIPFVAVTVNVSEVPFVNPEIVIGLDVPVALWPVDAVTV